MTNLSSAVTSVVAPKTNIPNASGSTLAPASNGGRLSVLAPTTNLSAMSAALSATTSSSSWKAPFKKDHDRARVNTLQPLERECDEVGGELS